MPYNYCYLVLHVSAFVGLVLFLVAEIDDQLDWVYDITFLYNSVELPCFPEH